MKNYANRKESDLFTLILAFEEYLKIFSECEFLSDIELRKVKNAIKNIHEMSESVKERLGLVFLKKIKSFLDHNQLGFYAKGITRDLVVNNISDEMIEELLHDAQWAFGCIGCERQDHVNCKYYRFQVEMGKEGNGKSTGCPFR